MGIVLSELFDVSNLLEDGTVAPLTSHRAAMNKGNSLFHVDSSFNPRRAGYSLLKAHELPPKGTGGATEFADTRTAFVRRLMSMYYSRLLLTITFNVIRMSCQTISSRS